MEALIRKIFPTVRIEDTNELVKLSEYLDRNDVHIDYDNGEFSTLGEAADMPASVVDHSEREQIAAGPNPTPRSLPTPPSSTCSYERMLKNSSGTLSYFGSSSSMSFVLKIREFLAVKANQYPDSIPRRQRRLRDEFTTDSRSCTMEMECTADTLGRETTSGPDLRSLGRLHSSNCGRTGTLSKNPFKGLLVDILPSKPEVEELVELFFIHVHPNIILFHRPNFQATLEELWSHCDTEGLDVGWMVCFCVVLAFGCEWRVSTSHDKANTESQRLAELQEKLLVAALEKVAQLMLSATLQSVQAFTLLSIYFNCVNERNASWVMVGCAVRMATSMGLHRGGKILRGEVHLPPVDRELRKRVW